MRYVAQKSFAASNSRNMADSAKILEALHGLRFGGVEIVVHDGRIVQIERKEKLRLNIPCPNETAESVKLDDVI